jgi:DNA repair protein RadA/Sms
LKKIGIYHFKCYLPILGNFSTLQPHSYILISKHLMKVKSAFFCSNCGTESPKWVGKCPSCGEWNTYQEEIIEKKTTQAQKDTAWKDTKVKIVPKKLNDIESLSNIRVSTQDGELDRVLGGGLVAGSIILIGGQPGIGKSTLMLQVALNIGRPILYVSGEESEEQIKMRANRIAKPKA